MIKGDLLKKRGFTIIEVSLVMAIAGLIFLMVFVALPGLRASQRDTQRRSDVLTLLEAVKKYQTNNRGALPGGNATGVVEYGKKIGGTPWSDVDENTWAGFYRDYLGENFRDPSGASYKLNIAVCGNTITVDAECTGDDDVQKSFPNDYKMFVVLQAKCSGDQAVGSSNPRKLAVLYRMQGSGIYCNSI